MSFVAEAFAGLSRHFIRSTQIGAIRKNDPYLSNLVAYAGYEKPEVSYQRYINSLIESMSIVKDENNFEILDFESFINFYVPIIRHMKTRNEECLNQLKILFHCKNLN